MAGAGLRPEVGGRLGGGFPFSVRLHPREVPRHAWDTFQAWRGSNEPWTTIDPQKILTLSGFFEQEDFHLTQKMGVHDLCMSA